MLRASQIGNQSTKNTHGLKYDVEVARGTPEATFLVALDTGSDLLWVPCRCKQCVPLSKNDTAEGWPQLREYSPRLLSTSTPMTCNNPLRPAQHLQHNHQTRAEL